MGNSFKDTILSMVITALLIYTLNLHLSLTNPYVYFEWSNCTALRSPSLWLCLPSYFISHLFSKYHTYQGLFARIIFLINVNDFLLCFALDKHSDTCPLNFHCTACHNSTEHLPHSNCIVIVFILPILSG